MRSFSVSTDKRRPRTSTQPHREGLGTRIKSWKHVWMWWDRHGRREDSARHVILTDGYNRWISQLDLCSHYHAQVATLPSSILAPSLHSHAFKPVMGTRANLSCHWNAHVVASYMATWKSCTCTIKSKHERKAISIAWLRAVAETFLYCCQNARSWLIGKNTTWTSWRSWNFLLCDVRFVKCSEENKNIGGT